MVLSSKYFRVALVVGVVVLAACLLALVATQEPAEATFPGKNGRIAFTRMLDWRGDREIYTIRPDGSGLRRATNAPSSSSFNPAWSPDGTKLAFSSGRDGDAEIYVKDMRSGQLTQLTHNEWQDPEHPEYDFDPAWSPDGSKIVYVRIEFCCQVYQLWVMDSDGSNNRVLSQTASGQGGPIAFDPEWSPDGSKIAFYNGPDINAGFFDIYVIDPDGSNLRKLTNSSGDISHGSPTWSPNSQWIAWDRSSTSFPSPGSDIWKMAPDGSGKIRLTSSPPASEGSPTWSPGGGKIVYKSGVDLFKINASDGTGETNITNTEDVIEIEPTWQPKVASVG
jgi:Tol biopolymer transport system component